MINTGKLAGRTIFISGASRGIGKAIALKTAADGANVVIAAKTTEPHPKLPGTIYTAAEEIEKAGGKCLPLKVDIRNEDEVASAIKQTIDKFGSLDILVNNASAISLTPTEQTPMKKYDLMNQINTRGTFMLSKYAIPHLKKSNHAHILTMSPPLDFDPVWFKNHVAYTISKFGMSLCALGMSAELKDHGIAVNTLWPRTLIWTAAADMLGGIASKEMSRKDSIMSDAAYAILSQDPKSFTGNFCVDEEVLRNNGVTDFDQYRVAPGKGKLLADFFLPSRYLQGDDILNALDVQGKPANENSGNAPAGNNEADVEAEGETGKIFRTMSANVSDDLKNEINAVMSFVISGNNWCVDAHSSRPLKISREEHASPNVTFITDEATFLKMAKGEIKAASAFMSGKLKVKGDLGIAMKAEKIFAKIRKASL